MGEWIGDPKGDCAYVYWCQCHHFPLPAFTQEEKVTRRGTHIEPLNPRMYPGGPDRTPNPRLGGHLQALY